MKNTLLLSLLVLSLLTLDLMSQWQECNFGLNNYMSCIAKCDSIILIGNNYNVVISKDNGITYDSSTYINSRSMNISSFQVIDKYVFASYPAGVLVSTDKGLNWKGTDYNLPQRKNTIGKLGKVLYCQSEEDLKIIYFTDDYGKIWNKKTLEFPFEKINLICEHKNKILSSTNKNLYISDDGGKNWVKSIIDSNDKIISMLSFNGNLFLTTHLNNILKSTDDGLTWNKLPINQIKSNINNIYSNNNILYLCTNGNGIYYSDDNAVSWKHFTNGIAQNGIIHNLVFSYDNSIFINSDDGIYISKDNFSTFKRTLNVNSDIKTNYLTSDNSVVYVGSVNSGIFASNNDGNSWTNLIGDFDSQKVNGMIAKDSTLIANIESTGKNNFKPVLYISNDFGKTWENCTLQSALFSRRMDFAKSKNSFFIASGDFLYYSYDKGKTWKSHCFVGSQDWFSSDVFKVVANDTCAIFSFSKLVDQFPYYLLDSSLDYSVMMYKNKDTLLSFNRTPKSVLYPVYADNEIIFAKDSFLLSSNDNGKNWTKKGINFNFHPMKIVRSENKIFALSAYLRINDSPASRNKLYYSNDLGTTWNDLSTTISDSVLFDLTISNNFVFVSTQSQGVYKAKLEDFLSFHKKSDWTAIYNNSNVGAISSNSNKIYASFQNKGLVYSTNNGDNWMPIDTNLSKKNIQGIDNYNSRYIFIEPYVAYYSNNEFKSWNTLNIQFAYKDNTIRKVAIDDKNLYAATEKFLYTSNDEGKNWYNYKFGSSDNYYGYISDIKLLNEVVYVSYNEYDDVSKGYNAFLYTSKDNSKTFIKMKESLKNNKINNIQILDNQIFTATENGFYLANSTNDVWIEKNSNLNNLSINNITVYGNNIFACTNSGIYLSKDRGNNWIDINDGISSYYNATFSKIINNYIYVGLSNNGLIKSNLSNFNLDNIDSEIQLNNSFILYPNPVKSKFYLEIKDFQNNEKIRIIDLLGNVILESELKESLDISNLNLGAYYIKIGNKINKLIKIEN